MFTLDPQGNEIYLMYEDEAIDVFDTLAIAKVRLNVAKEIENEIDKNISNECPAMVYDSKFNSSEKMEAIVELKNKQNLKNERHNNRVRRRQESGRNNRSPLYR